MMPAHSASCLPMITKCASSSSTVGWRSGRILPPKEKRGLVIVDPPFEQAGEFGRLLDGLSKAHRRWPGGIYALWYPVKDRAAVAAFVEKLRQAGIPKILDVRLFVRAPSSEPRLDGSGMIVVNPPYTLEADLRTILPALHSAMAKLSGAGWTLEWLAREARNA